MQGGTAQGARAAGADGHDGRQQQANSQLQSREARERDEPLDPDEACAATGDETPMPTDEAEPLEVPQDPDDAGDGPQPANEELSGLFGKVPTDLGGEAAEDMHLGDNPDEESEDLDQLLKRINQAPEGEAAGCFDADLAERPAEERMEFVNQGCSGAAPTDT